MGDNSTVMERVARNQIIGAVQTDIPRWKEAGIVVINFIFFYSRTINHRFPLVQKLRVKLLTYWERRGRIG